jgi:hypothetical protein
VGGPVHRSGRGHRSIGRSDNGVARVRGHVVLSLVITIGQAVNKRGQLTVIANHYCRSAIGKKGRTRCSLRSGHAESAACKAPGSTPLPGAA